MIATNASTTAKRVNRIMQLPVNENPGTTITGRDIEAGIHPLAGSDNINRSHQR